MKKKQLLAESEIRQFMKFANIGSLASPFVERMNETYEMGLTEQEEEEDLEAEDPMADPMGGEEDLEAPPEDPGMEDMDVEAEPEAGGDVDAALQGVMKSVEVMKKGFVEMGMPEVADAIGLSATDDDELGGDEDLDADLGGEEDLDMGLDAGEDVAAEVPPEEGEEDIEALDEAGIYMESTQNDVVNEVARRVARRLLQARSGRRRR